MALPEDGWSGQSTADGTNLEKNLGDHMFYQKVGYVEFFCELFADTYSVVIN